MGELGGQPVHLEGVEVLEESCGVEGAGGVVGGEGGLVEDEGAEVFLDGFVVELLVDEELGDEGFDELVAGEEGGLLWIDRRLVGIDFKGRDLFWWWYDTVGMAQPLCRPIRLLHSLSMTPERVLIWITSVRSAA